MTASDLLPDIFAEAIVDSDVGVAAYEFFGLRDSRSDAGWTSGFGLLRDDYSPKPAFAALRDFMRRNGKALT